MSGVTYSSIADMAASQSLTQRIVAAAAEEGVPTDPNLWVNERIWQIVSADSGWATAWDYAKDTATADNNPDTGARPGVINDAMILAVIQPMVNPAE